MTNFPSISVKQLLIALQKSGFELIRIKGSHHFMRHADGRSNLVPVHSNESIGPGLLAKKLRDCDIIRDQLHQLL